MNVWQIIAQEQRKGVCCVVITILQVRGSVPGMVGAKAVVTTKGLLVGTLGGGRVEAKAIAEALRLLDSDQDGCLECCWNLQRDVGMTCGGEMRFLFEVLRTQSPWHVVVYAQHGLKPKGVQVPCL